MSTVIECEHGSPPEVCPPCNPAGRAFTAPPAPDQLGPTFAAQFAGRCGGCDGSIEPGQAIRRVSDLPLYRHVRCT